MLRGAGPAATRTGIVADERDLLADRIRTALIDEPTTREVRMFGGLSFMVNDKMVVAAQGEGDLLVRIDPARNSELTVQRGAKQAEMSSGRAMGPGWINVGPEAIDTDERLAFWIEVAMDYNATAAQRDEAASGSRRDQDQ